MQEHHITTPGPVLDKQGVITPGYSEKSVLTYRRPPASGLTPAAGPEHGGRQEETASPRRKRRRRAGKRTATGSSGASPPCRRSCGR